MNKKDKQQQLRLALNMPVEDKVEGIDFTPLTFGKYKGLTPEKIALRDPSYIVWAYENDIQAPLISKTLYTDCLNDIRKYRAEDEEDDSYDYYSKYNE